MASAPDGPYSASLVPVSAGVYDWCACADKLHVADRWLGELGHTPGQLPPNLDWDWLLHPRDLPRWRHRLNGCLSCGNAPIKEHLRVRRGTGEWCWVEVCAEPAERDAAGRAPIVRGRFSFLAAWQVQLFNRLNSPGHRRPGALTPLRRLQLARMERRRTQDMRASARTLAENLPVGAIVTSLAGTCLYVNAAWERIAGVSAAQAAGSGWLQAIHPEDRERVRCGWIEHARARQPYRAEFRFVRADDSEVWASVAAAEIREQDASLGFIGVVEDITRRRSFVDSLKGNRHFLQTLAESVPDLVYLYDLESGAVTYANRSDEGLAGYPQELAMDDADFAFQVVVPEDHGIVRAHRSKLAKAQDGELITLDVRCRHRNGSIIWNHCRESVFARHADGRPRLILGIATDVTSQRLMQEQLRTQHTRLELAVNATNDIVFHCDGPGERAFMSPRFRELVGAAAADPADPIELWLSRVHHDDAARVREALGSMRTQPGPRVFEFRLRTANGQYRWFLGRGQATRRGNDLAGLAGSISDIHDRKVAEESLFLYSKDLEEAKSRAEAADRAKGDFLAMMSHEIRTPMNGIIGAVHLLMETALNPDQSEFADILNSSCEHLLSILNDILDFSKIEAGRMSLEKVPFAFDKLLESAIAVMQPKADLKKLDLSLRIAPEVPRQVLGDPARIRQVLFNLLGNALKFTEKGGVTVEAEVLSTTSAGPVVQVRVSDTGIGVVSSRLDSLFEPFVQADASTTRRFGGTGLGLAISRRLLELMGGAIGVESREGAGSVFTFTLPLLAVDQASAARSGNFEGLRALVITNDLDRSELLILRFQQAGLATSTLPVSSAAETLIEAGARGSGFHFAAIDCTSCGPESCSLARQLATHDELADLVVLLVNPPAGGPHNPKVTGSIPFPTELDDFTEALAYARELRLKAVCRTAVLRNQPRILLVEDNLVNQKLGVKLLEKLGCAVQVASNGAEAVSMWENQVFDAIFMDCLMPVMDGYQATREIRIREVKRPERTRVPIFAFTANALGDRDRCFLAGMDDFIAKPIRLDVLRSTLQAWTAPQKTAAVGVR